MTQTRSTTTEETAIKKERKTSQRAALEVLSQGRTSTTTTLLMCSRAFLWRAFEASPPLCCCLPEFLLTQARERRGSSESGDTRVETRRGAKEKEVLMEVERERGGQKKTRPRLLSRHFLSPLSSATSSSSRTGDNKTGVFYIWLNLNDAKTLTQKRKEDAQKFVFAAWLLLIPPPPCLTSSSPPPRPFSPACSSSSSASAAASSAPLSSA